MQFKRILKSQSNAQFNSILASATRYWPFGFKWFILAFDWI